MVNNQFIYCLILGSKYVVITIKYSKFTIQWRIGIYFFIRKELEGPK
jgi:hypothetical protein